MVLNDQQTTMDSLKDKGPEAWLEYLLSFEQGSPLAGLSMQVVFHYAAPLAKDQNSLEWAEIAVRAAELEARNCSGVERENALLWAMNLRSWFLCRMGTRAGHQVLDKSIILNWVAEGLKLPIRTAKGKAASLSVKLAEANPLSDQEETRRIADDLRELRRIKHRLNVVNVLVDCDELASDPVLKEWLGIREQLP